MTTPAKDTADPGAVWGELKLTLDQAFAVHRIIGLRLDDERAQGRRPDEELRLREVMLQLERIRFDHESRSRRA